MLVHTHTLQNEHFKLHISSSNTIQGQLCHTCMYSTIEKGVTKNAFDVIRIACYNELGISALSAACSKCCQHYRNTNVQNSMGMVLTII